MWKRTIKEFNLQLLLQHKLLQQQPVIQSQSGVGLQSTETQVRLQLLLQYKLLQQQPVIQSQSGVGLTVVLHHFDSVLQTVVVEVCVVIEAVFLPVPLLTVVLHHFDSVLQGVGLQSTEAQVRLQLLLQHKLLQQQPVIQSQSGVGLQSTETSVDCSPTPL
jgi:hypothetical protein